MREQERRLRLGLDAFGGHVHAERSAHGQHRAHHLLAGPAAGHLAHQMAIDFQTPHAPTMQPADRRRTGAEIVDDEGDAEPLEGGQRGHDARVVIDEHGLGNLNLQVGGAQGLGTQQRSQIVGERQLQDLPARQVHRHRHREAGIAHAPRLGAGGGQRPAPDRHDETGVFGQRQELGRQYQAVTGPAPAQQRLAARDALARGLPHRLEVQFELAAPEGLGQRRRLRRPFARVHVHGRRVVARAILASRLRGIHRRVGVAQQRRGVEAVAGEQTDADAGRELQGAAIDDDGCGRRGENLRGERGGVQAVVEIFHHHHELIAAETGHGVHVARAACETARHLGQHAVATFVAV